VFYSLLLFAVADWCLSSTPRGSVASVCFLKEKEIERKVPVEVKMDTACSAETCEWKLSKRKQSTQNALTFYKRLNEKHLKQVQVVDILCMFCTV
jgi:hypothetical protein